MFNKDKGEYGYLKSYKKMRLFFSCLFGVVILGIIILLLVLFKTTKTVYVVVPILLALPFSKNFIGYILCVKFKPLNEEKYNTINNSIKEDTKRDLLFDVVISQYEGMLFYQSICIRNGKVYALIQEKPDKTTEKKYEKWIYESIYDGKHDIIIKIFSDIDDYIKKTNQISEPNHNTMLVDAYMRETLLTYCV
ncbi:MAG: hypothetical protein PUG10_04320 [Lachnospiraceae bacterium]|nr:hypothetical protein [Lachnospiraceae bacterium]